MRFEMDKVEINNPLGFVPGEEWSYSNAGYHLLGYIIEEVSGDPYLSFLRGNIFEPLGMENTGYDVNGIKILEHHAEGYASRFNRADYLHMSFAYAAGGLHSTVEDLYLWEQALFGGEVVSQEAWDAMIESAVPLPDEGLYYGYGLVINMESDHPMIGHGGAMPGFTSVMRHYPNDNVTIIILSNRQDAPSWTYADIFEDVLFDD
jgi:D-alanyl-D-alanine carboxypeptidase